MTSDLENRIAATLRTKRDHAVAALETLHAAVSAIDRASYHLRQVDETLATEASKATILAYTVTRELIARLQ